MVAKISITLPNGSVVTIEGLETEDAASLIGSLLRDVSTLKTYNVLPRTAARQPAWGTTRDTSIPGFNQQFKNESALKPVALPDETDPRWDEFRSFCKRANPLGDMRRVVAAAEGAHRYLGVNAVSTRELAHLFKALNWTQPPSIVQTVRNGARSIFRWLERVPNRRGFYTVTDTGRRVVLGEDYVPDRTS
jgi:hypothetical protein